MFATRHSSLRSDGHDLRAGFVTNAVKRGANLIKIMDVTGHKSLEMLKTIAASRGSATPVLHSP